MKCYKGLRTLRKKVAGCNWGYETKEDNGRDEQHAWINKKCNKTLAEKPEGKVSRGRPKRKWVYDIKRDIKSNT